MDFLQALYHSFVDFILMFLYFFTKLGEFITSLINIVLIPFNFVKDIITGLDFSKTYTFNYQGGQILSSVQNNLGFPVLAVLGLFMIVLIWKKVKSILS
jgi:hypothetical protein